MPATRSEEAKQQLQKLITKRSTLFATATAIYDKAKSYIVKELPELLAYCERLPTLEQNFNEIQDSILDINIALPKEDQVQITPTQIALEDLLASINAIRYRLKSQEPVNQVATLSDNANISVSSMLRRIQLPAFDDKIEKWPEFISIYDSLVHNATSLENTQKFQYLKTALKGEALSIISGFQLTSDNYKIAYDALVAHFQNKRRIASMYLKKIISFKASSSSSLSSLKEFLDVHQTAVNAIKALALTDLSDYLLFSLALGNMDSRTQRAFENKHVADSIPTFDQLIEFVNQQVRVQELSDPPSKSAITAIKSKTPRSNILLTNSEPKPRTVLPRLRNITCPLCKAIHFLYQCPRFSVLPVADKYTFLRDNNRCFNCLGRHSRDDCPSKAMCRYCHTNKHHSTLHPMESRTPATSGAPSTSSAKASPPAPLLSTVSDAIQSMSCVASSSPSQVLLGTIQLYIEDVQGTPHKIRAIYDPGSHVTAITQSCVRLLGLNRKPSSVNVSGLGQSHLKNYGYVTCYLHPTVSSKIVTAQALVLPAISCPLPSAPLEEELYNKFRHLQLADDSFHIPGKVDFLNGADMLPQTLIPDEATTVPGTPTAINTVFGWILIGPTSEAGSSNSVTSLHVVASDVTSDINENLGKFWETEEVPTSAPLDPLDILAEQLFVSTHKRDETGRFHCLSNLTPLPFSTMLRGHYSLSCESNGDYPSVQIHSRITRTFSKSI